jgi:hypothetical protein
MITLILFIALNFLFHHLFKGFNNSRIFIGLRTIPYFFCVILFLTLLSYLLRYIDISISEILMIVIVINLICSIFLRGILFILVITVLKWNQNPSKQLLGGTLNSNVKTQIPYSDISFGLFVFISFLNASFLLNLS